MPIPSHKTLEQVLDYSALKHKVIGQNIANANTENYKRREIEFKELLQKDIQSLSSNHQEISEFEVKIDEETAVIGNGNNVNVNQEMANMAENSIMFKFAAKKINSYYQSIQSVIRGGK